MVLAWPQAEIAVMGAEGAANIVFRKDIEGAEDSTAMRSKKIEDYREAFANPYVAAERGLVDRVILPEATREEIWQALAGTKPSAASARGGNTASCPTDGKGGTRE